jgi:hypothetical protein
LERLPTQLATNISDEKDVESKQIKHNELFARYLETLKSRGKTPKSSPIPKQTTQKDILNLIERDRIDNLVRDPPTFGNVSLDRAKKSSRTSHKREKKLKLDTPKIREIKSQIPRLSPMKTRKQTLKSLQSKWLFES